MQSKRQLWIRLGLVVAIIVVLNLLAGQFYTRLDLTEEGRYSLSALSESTMDSLPDVVNIRVYLEGNLPVEVRPFRQSVEAMLEELKAIGGSRLQFQFIDLDRDAQPQLKVQLTQMGVQPIMITEHGESEASQKLIYPAAVINFRGEEAVVNLLQHDCFSSQAGHLMCDYTRAEAELEYKLISTIRRLVSGKRRIVGILTSHIEHTRQQLDGFIKELGTAYNVIAVNLDSAYAIPSSTAFLPEEVRAGIEGDGIDVLIVPQLNSALSERQKYELDQYFMRGGRLMILNDGAQVLHSDFERDERVLSLTRELNTTDWYLKYGFKINADLVQDMRCYQTDVVVEQANRPVIVQKPWLYFPILIDFNRSSPITQHVQAITYRYGSSLDTLPTPGVTFTPLVRSSEYSRSLNSPVEISFPDMLRSAPPRSVFANKGHQLMALLAEGTFSSLYDGRQAPLDSTNPNPPTARFLPRSAIPNKLIVMGDGDILMRDHRQGMQNMPFNNLAFLMNAVDYLINDTTYAEVRNKTVSARNLNAVAVQYKGSFYQVLNLVLPVLVVIIIGILRYILRTRRNRKLKQLV